MKKQGIIFTVILMLLGITACGTITSKLHKQEEAKNKLGLSFAKDRDNMASVLDSLYSTDFKAPTVITDDKGKVYYEVENQKDETTGELMPSFQLTEVVVTQKLRNIVERNGKIELDFIITVPKTLIDDRWQLRVYPRAFKDNEERIDLEPVVLSGASFLKQQEKGYSQYKAFVASIIPDSLYWKEMVNQKGVAKALSDLEIEYHNAWQKDLFKQNQWIDWRDRINKRYMLFNSKMERNRQSIDIDKSLLSILPAYWLRRDFDKRSVPRTFAEYAWGNKEIVKRTITPEDSLEIEKKFTDLQRIAENERKRQEKESMFDKLVKFPRIAARLDSIVPGHQDFKYYYTQELEADDGCKKILLVLDGEVVAVDLSRYDVPSSDTLTYSVAAVVDLIDESPRYKTKTIYRQVDKEVSAKIEFEVASATVKPELSNNLEELEKIKDVIFDLEDGGALILDSLSMVGYASPEGSSSYNSQLANRRTKALKDYLLSNNYFKGRKMPVRAENGGENWIGVMAWLNDTTKHDYSELRKTEIINLLNRYDNEDERERALRDKLPEVYQVMREALYPNLRETVFKFYTHRAEMQEEKIETTVIDETYNKGRDLLRARKYKEAMEVLSAYHDDYNYALCLMSLGYDNPALGILRDLPNAEDNPDVQYLMAILYVRLGEIQKAVNHLHRAGELQSMKIFRAKMDPELNMIIEKYNLYNDFFDF